MKSILKQDEGLNMMEEEESKDVKFEMNTKVSWLMNAWIFGSWVFVVGYLRIN